MRRTAERSQISSRVEPTRAGPRHAKSNPHRGVTLETIGARMTPKALAVAAGCVSLLLGLYQLTRPGVLTGVLGYNLGYDDSVHIGVPTRLVHGSIPYRDFVFVHPPGIAYLLLPVALIGRVVGTADAVVLARIITVVVVAANAVLAAWVVRRSGRVAVAVAGFAVALWPLTVSVDRNVELEPFAILFALLGALVVFGDEPVSPRRLTVGGALFGFACVVKVWAVLPVAAALLCCLPGWRDRLRPVVRGFVIGGVVPCLPFFLLAPTDFVHDVITAQLSRNVSYAGGATPFGDRLLLLSGFGGWGGLTDDAAPAIAFFVVFAALVAITFGLGRAARIRVEWFVLVAAVIVNLGMFVSREFYDHYAYFPAVFLALLLGVSINGTVQLVAHRMTKPLQRRPVWVPAASAAVLAAVTLVGVAHNTAYARLYLSEASDQSDVIRSVIPEGACVLTDYPIDLLVAERFTARRSDCPPIVDPFGMYLTEDDGNQPHPYPPFRPAFVNKWRGWLEKADYVILRIEYSHFLPWPQDQIAWFSEHFALVAHDRVVYERLFLDPRKDIYIYRNIDRVAPSVAEVDSLLDSGVQAQQAGRLDEAQSLYAQVLSLDATNKLAAYDLGVIAQQQGRVDDARTWYERALKTDPAYKPALYNLAILLTPTQPDGAVGLYRSLLALDPNDANVHFQLGLVLQQLGQDDKAAAEFEEAVRIDPSYAARVPER